MTDLEKLVDQAAIASQAAKSTQAREEAARRRKEARERCNIAIMEIGRLIALLNRADRSA